MEDLKNTLWLGEIVDSNDPEKQGRCKIKIYEKFDQLPPESMPWAYPANSHIFAGGETKGYGSFEYPKVGSLVRVKFNSGNIYYPEYSIVENINESMKSLINGSYENSHVTLFDEDEQLQIYYTKEKGLVLSLKNSKIFIENSKDVQINHADGSKIVIKADTITIDTGSKLTVTAPTIELNGSSMVGVGTGASYSIPKSEMLEQVIMALASAIDAKLAVTTPITTNLIQGLWQTVPSQIGKVAN